MAAFREYVAIIERTAPSKLIADKGKIVTEQIVKRYFLEDLRDLGVRLLEHIEQDMEEISANPSDTGTVSAKLKGVYKSPPYEAVRLNVPNYEDGKRV